MIEKYVRSHLIDLIPYSSARDEYTGAAEVYLDANENPFDTGLNRYPDPYQRKLKKKLSDLKGIPTNNILIGNGSDEVIDLLVRLFCEPRRDSIVTLDPTYGYYQVAAGISNVSVKKIPLGSGWTLPVEKILSTSEQGDKILFICNPNNPTGSVTGKEDILAVVRDFDGIVVIDEAYVDFCPEVSLIKKIPDFPKLVIIQTLSKAWGLAGARLGLCFANNELIGFLNKIKPPYNINDLSQTSALKHLSMIEQRRAWIRTIIEEREKLKVALSGFAFVDRIFPSFANFLLTKVNDPERLVSFLRDRGIIIRDRSKMRGCQGCVRISVGTPRENIILLENLQNYE